MRTVQALPRLRMQVAVGLATVLLATMPAAAVAGGHDDMEDTEGTEGTEPLSGPCLYDITTETGMPHLEESLRYAVVRQRSCLDPRDLSRAFWMLDHVSLQDCRLAKTAQAQSSARYELRCDGGHGTSGHARWEIGPERLRGTLDVKLGGKNMTFYQRILARRVGQCPDQPAAPEGPDRPGRADAPASFSCSFR